MIRSAHASKQHRLVDILLWSEEISVYCKIISTIMGTVINSSLALASLEEINDMKKLEIVIVDFLDTW